MVRKFYFLQVESQCVGKSSCSIYPTSTMFNIYCNGWRRMWITYSCDGGMDMTTKLIPARGPNNITPPSISTCSTRRGAHKSFDIPLDGGNIKIRCTSGGGDRHRVKRQAGNMMMPCISIHKVMVGCNAQAGMISAHRHLVSYF